MRTESALPGFINTFPPCGQCTLPRIPRDSLPNNVRADFGRAGSSILSDADFRMQNLCCGLYGLRGDCWVFAAGRKTSARRASYRSEALSPLRGLVIFQLGPTACAVGCILSPLRGWERARSSTRTETYEPCFSRTNSAFLADCFSLRKARATSPSGVGSETGPNSQSGRSPWA